jgi:guanylate kinase
MGCGSTNSVQNEQNQDSTKNKVLVVVGPSGVGKDTLMQKVFDKHPNVFRKGVTHTSRKMRPGEKEGYNYYYVTEEEFLKLKEENKFVEFNYYNKNYYGLSKMELENQSKGNKILYVIIDINGAKNVNKANIPANYVAILPPDEETLEKRLKGRGTENDEVIKGRLETAKTELKEIEKCEFFNHKVYNSDLDKAVLDMEQFLKSVYPNNFN